VSASDWRNEAACLDHDAEKWFPTPRTVTARVHTAFATAVCAQCPVRAQCLGYALDHDIVDGIWGGLDEKAREPHRRRIDRRCREESAVEPDMAGRVEPTETRVMISAYRDAGVTWRQISEWLGTSQRACRDVHLGVRQTVRRATEESAKALAAQLVSA
jgi:WhiB family redox-sensing transcriptional regulator